MIVRVWGTADQFDLEFYRTEGNQWAAPVITDFDDGQYAVQIFAQNEWGGIGVYTGMLYLCDGISCLHIFRTRFMPMILPPKLNVGDVGENIYATMFSDRLDVFLRDGLYNTILIKECDIHG